MPKQEKGPDFSPELHDTLRVDVESFYESLELLLAMIAIGVIVGYAVQAFPILTTKFKVVEPLLLSAGDRVWAHEHFAVTGTWPVARALAEEDSPKRISELTRAVSFAEGGRLDYSLDLERMPNAVLSFRPFVSSADSPTSIVWLCADATAPAEFRSFGADATTIDEAFLPAPCRHIRKNR